MLQAKQKNKKPSLSLWLLPLEIEKFDSLTLNSFNPSLEFFHLFGDPAYNLSSSCYDLKELKEPVKTSNGSIR